MICCANSALVHESRWSFSILQSSWHHCGILKSAMVGTFTPCKSRTSCFSLSYLFPSTWLDIWLCVCMCVWLSWTEFLWLPSLHMCESAAWGWGDSAFCHFLTESMLVGSEVGISKWNVSATLGSDMWLTGAYFQFHHSKNIYPPTAHLSIYDPRLVCWLMKNKNIPLHLCALAPAQVPGHNN